METLREILRKSFDRGFISAVISNPREKGGTTKVKIRPIIKKKHYYFNVKNIATIRLSI